jgi:hypothetical protein
MCGRGLIEKRTIDAPLLSTMIVHKNTTKKTTTRRAQARSLGLTSVAPSFPSLPLIARTTMHLSTTFLCPNCALLYDLSVAIDRLPMHFMSKNEINNNLSFFEDTLGGCERLLSSPMPLFYTRHTARFLSTWLLLLPFIPFAMYDPFKGSWNHIALIPTIALASIFPLWDRGYRHPTRGAVHHPSHAGLLR